MKEFVEFKNYMTIQDFMAQYDVSRQTVYNKIKSGELVVKKWLNRTLVKAAA